MTKKYLRRSSGTKRNVEESFTDRFKRCRQTKNTKQQMNSPLKRSEVEGRAERIHRVYPGEHKLKA